MSVTSKWSVGRRLSKFRKVLGQVAFMHQENRTGVYPRTSANTPVKCGSCFTPPPQFCTSHEVTFSFGNQSLTMPSGTRERRVSLLDEASVNRGKSGNQPQLLGELRESYNALYRIAKIIHEPQTGDI